MTDLKQKRRNQKAGAYIFMKARITTLTGDKRDEITFSINPKAQFFGSAGAWKLKTIEVVALALK